MIVKVGHRHPGEPLAQQHHQLRRGQRTAAEGEEIRLRPVDDGAQDVLPQPGEPAHGAAQLRSDIGDITRWGPRQRVAVDLSRGAGGQFALDQDQARHQRRGQRLGQVRPGGRQVEVRVGGGDIADEHRCAAGGLAHRRGSTADSGKVNQSGIHLAQFDPAPADLDLIIGTALEVEAVGFQPHQIPAAIGARPPQRRHRRVLLGVLLRIQVAGQSDAPDHQLSDLTQPDRGAGGIHHRQIPARQWQSDADRRAGVDLRAAGHHGRLGGAVGVPHLAAVHGQPVRQVRRAGLPAEDQQPHRLQCFRRPQRRQGRDRRDHGDVPGDQPGPQVHATAHQRPGGRYQGGAVPPGQPHLLAGRVETDRQTRENPVAGSDRVVPQEHPRLGIDEGRGVTVADRHALRGSGRAGGEDDPGVVADPGRLGGPAA